MKKNYDLLQGNIFRIFLKFMITSTSGMIMISLYILCDTIFVGQGIGKEGLAALNISLPVYNLLFGSGILLGSGSATVLSISMGGGNEKKAVSAFNHSIILGIIIGIFYSIFGLLFIDKISIFLGASEESLPLVKEYLSVIIPFSWSFLMVYNLAAIVRNDHGPRRAMIAMGAGGLTNIVFDYIFIFPLKMGMRGAAIATVMSSLVSLIILLYHFYGAQTIFKLRNIKLALDINMIIKIIGIGIGSFIIEMSSGIVIFLFNAELLKQIGDIGVSAYSIIANISLICVAVFTGIAQGMQPISSINYGAQNLSRVNTVKRLGVVTALGLGIFFLVLGIAIPKYIIALFTMETGEIVNITAEGIKYYFIAFPIMAINIVMGGYFQSIEKARYATLLSLCRGIIFTSIGLKLMAAAFGVKGIWITVPIAEVITVVIIAGVLLYDRRLKAKYEEKMKKVS